MELLQYVPNYSAVPLNIEAAISTQRTHEQYPKLEPPVGRTLFAPVFSLSELASYLISAKPLVIQIYISSDA